MLFYSIGSIFFWYRDSHSGHWPPFYPDFLILTLSLGLLIFRFLGFNVLNPKCCLKKKDFQKNYEEIEEEEEMDFS